MLTFIWVSNGEFIFLGADVKVGEPVEPGLPLRVKLLEKVFLPLVVDGRILDSVQRKLFQVTKVELPGKHCIDVIQGNSFVGKEGRIIRADGNLDSVSDQVSSRVDSKVQSVAKD